MKIEIDTVTDVSFNMINKSTMEILIRLNDDTRHSIILKPIEKKKIEVWKT